MFLKYALMGWTLHMQEVEERNQVDKMMAKYFIILVYKVQINLEN